MKDNLDIEKLFQQNFENFEGDVKPELWNNISQGIAGGTTAATGGMSAILKTVLISGGIVAAGLTGVYIGVESEETTEENLIVDTIIDSNNNNETQLILQDSVINVEDANDPTIIEYIEEIERELGNKHYDDEVDEELVNQIIFSDDNGDEDDEDNNNIIEENNVVQDENNNNVSEDETEVSIPTGRLVYFPDNGTPYTKINFESNAKNYNSVKWDFGDGTTAVGPNVSHDYNRPGNYTVIMKVYGDGKVYEESKIVEIKTKSSIDNIPNVITPDNDRINDLFTVKTTEIKTFFISISDTQGNVVFESNDKDFEWDGTNLFGDKVESGTYVYTIIAEGEDGGVFKIPGQLYVRY